MRENKEFIIVAIDGGAAAGKSSTARALSERFHLLHVDTGSFYRAATHLLLRKGVKRENRADILKALSSSRFGARVEGREARIEIDGAVPGREELRRPEVNDNVSYFAAEAAVRDFLLDYQRSQADVARQHGFRGLVMEGRDIGSVIFPDADLRFFLVAESSARQRRRRDEGQEDSVDERDRIDSGRKTAPLIRPRDAIEIDSTELSLDDVVERMSAMIENTLKHR